MVSWFWAWRIRRCNETECRLTAFARKYLRLSTEQNWGINTEMGWAWHTPIYAFLYECNWSAIRQRLIWLLLFRVIVIRDESCIDWWEITADSAKSNVWTELSNAIMDANTKSIYIRHTQNTHTTEDEKLVKMFLTLLDFTKSIYIRHIQGLYWYCNYYVIMI